MDDLMSAVLSIDCDARALRNLLEQGSDVNSRTEEGYTPLHLAAMADWREDEDGRMQVLLEAGAEIEARANTQAGAGWTPLVLAAAEGYACQVEMLIKWGANVEASDQLGQTPLMLAASQGLEAEEKICLLVQSGADTRKSCQGKTAFDYAVQFREALVSAGAGNEETSQVDRVIELLRTR